MPWYYAGPEAKPIGPVSLEELQSRRAGGVITAETYVIEHTGGPDGAGAWKKYAELFPGGAPAGSLPPIPPMAGMTPPPPRPPVVPPPMPAPPAPFPSVGGSVIPPPATHPAYTPMVPPHAAPHGYFPVRRTNACCAWGFGLSIAGFFLSPVCGLGLLLAAPGLLLCIVGIVQVHQRREESGQGLAITGAVLSAIALLIAIGFLSWFAPSFIRDHRQESRQQDSDDR